MDDLNAAYAQTVREVAASVRDVNDGQWGDRDWLRLVVDFESLAEDGGAPRTSSISFAIARAPDGPLEKVAFRLSPAAKAGFAEIGRIMQAQKGQTWTTSTLVVERDGRYDFQFAYTPPYRLGGQLNDTRYRDYLERYKAETGTP
ncbi:hypothetical protein [Luteimonas sp. FCS-9]|uniref:hypothetical protein n=1 Tax=Luteimonas sp. FCS-9 TaxID=1547516 RepID=UPI00063E7E0F|nr:hypothetical protein [Luteimonas sp. FCS-9]KLJ02482.1 hypothetical protein WQ56_02840 [Luteimonas sp. FCS-9]